MGAGCMGFGTVWGLWPLGVSSGGLGFLPVFGDTDAQNLSPMCYSLGETVVEVR